MWAEAENEHNAFIVGCFLFNFTQLFLIIRLSSGLDASNFTESTEFCGEAIFKSDARQLVLSLYTANVDRVGQR